MLMRDTLLKTGLINVAKTNTMLFLQNYPRHNFNEKKYEDYLSRIHEQQFKTWHATQNRAFRRKRPLDF